MNVNKLKGLCRLLPGDINWGDSITPDIVEHIEQAVITSYEVKLQEQEPFALYDGNKFYANEESAICGCADMAKLKPVFTHPTPIPEGSKTCSRDTDRLNFLDSNLKFKMGWQVGQAPAGNISVTAVIMGGKNIREAIDTLMLAAASEMAKEKQNG